GAVGHSETSSCSRVSSCRGRQWVRRIRFGCGTIEQTVPRPNKEADVTTRTQDGSTLADELMDRIGGAVGDKATGSRVFGDPVDREGLTVIPVAKARFGCGGGAGTGAREGEEGSGGGGGGGAMVSPIGYIELRDGTAEFKRISSPTDMLAVIAAGALAA